MFTVIGARKQLILMKKAIIDRIHSQTRVNSAKNALLPLIRKRRKAHITQATP